MAISSEFVVEPKGGWEIYHKHGSIYHATRVKGDTVQHRVVLLLPAEFPDFTLGEMTELFELSGGADMLAQRCAQLKKSYGKKAQTGLIFGLSGVTLQSLLEAIV